MPDFERYTIFGASLMSAGVSVAYNGEGQSQLSIVVCEDPNNGDEFIEPTEGRPYTFEYGQLRFRGLCQSVSTVKSSSAYPVYEIKLVDARDLLDACYVLLNGYSGQTTEVDNICNVYGYWESFGFGGSFSNDGGMWWYLVKEGLNRIINQNLTSWGGTIKFKGLEYGIDLSNMPVPPNLYRVGTDAGITLLELISQVCFDGGHDFILNITEENFIEVKTVSRVVQTEIDHIQNFIDTHEGVDATDLTKGKELRNEVTSAYIVGGDVETVQDIRGSSIVQFWGFDVDGNPIAGGSDPTDQAVRLNAESISDIIGSQYYDTTIQELMFAMVDVNCWQMYIASFKPDLAAAFKLNQRFNREFLQDLLNPQAAINDNTDTLPELTNILNSQHLLKLQKIYDFVRGAAENYYGRQFLVRIPFVSIAVEPETNIVRYSHEPIATGWSESGTALGLSTDKAILFQDQVGKLEPFFGYTDADTCNIGNLLLGDDAIIQGTDLYVRATIDTGVYFVQGIPCVIMSVPAAVFSVPLTPIGDPNALADLLNIERNKVDEIIVNNRAAGSFGLRIHPYCNYPIAAAVPLKHNGLSYGPFYKRGPSGKVFFQKDNTLVPWEYAGTSNMVAAARAKIESIVTNEQRTQTGNIKVAGAPVKNIGDAIGDNQGPIVTSMSLSYGADGVSTTYTMQTYTQKFGVFSKGNAERIRRLAQGFINQKNQLRKLQRAKLRRSQRALQSMLSFASYKELDEIMPRTPHNTLQAVVITDVNDKKRPAVTTATGQEARVSCNAHDDDKFKAKNAFMDMAGLLRPFTTNPDVDIDMPGFVEGTGLHPVSMINPFQSGNDIECYAYGQEFTTWGTYREDGPEDVRAIGLRAPLVLVGWGYGIDGQEPSGLISSEYLRDFSNWHAGVLETVWDRHRGVWGISGGIWGEFIDELDPNGGSGRFVPEGMSSGTFYNVVNKFNKRISRNKKGIVTYCGNLNKLIVVNYDC